MSYAVRSLDASTWDLFAELVGRNNGVYGGCWCIAHHLEQKTKLDNRTTKHDLVRTGDAHAALVIDDDGLAQGWAQYGSPAELPGIRHRREYDKDAPPLPDWRLTCIFVDSKHRGRGIGRVAVQGALDQLAERGGGLVEAISEATDGRQAQSRFLFSATVEMLEDFGFERGRQVGKHAWILSRRVPG